MAAPHTPNMEPIAICGMAMRLPGGIKTPEAYWDALYNKKDLRSPLPLSRYNVKGFNGDMGKTNTIQQQHGYFIEDDLAAFDAGLFTMTKNELGKADPQQRLLLMIVRECLESAGVTDYRGSMTALFVGTFSEDWLQRQSKEEQHPKGYVLTGHLDPMLANRLSFEYDLRGPSFVIKTACSSSMFALHSAVRSVQNRDCDAAIVAGANLNMGPNTTASMTQEGIMSPEGSCKTFDARADGYGRGEAINALYIKPLSHAIRDGNPIRAVIRNTCVNNDGQTTGLFATSRVAQEAMMRKAYADVGIDPSETAMVECHGTGTPVGDPIEATAVGNVFGQPHGVYIGSVKPNVGHAEASAGISSLMKAVLALEHKTIPPNIKFEVPNPRIPFVEKKVTVPVEPMPWPEKCAHRISVNSFGIGGSNGHCILESAEQHLADFTPSPGTDLAVLSANSQDSLKTKIDELKQYIQKHSDRTYDLSYTLARRREQLKWRSFAVLSNPETVNFAPPMNKPSKAPSVVMVFSGQGAQWPQMGRELLDSVPGVREDILKMDTILHSCPNAPTWNIIDELCKTAAESKLGKAELAQPLSTVVQIALIEALKRLGVRPQGVVGHSSGEIAAAYAAGALTLRQAITSAYYRGYVSTKSTTTGGMAAIGLGAEATRKYLPDRVVVACENSPTSTTISGDADQLQVALKAIKDAHPDALARALKVDMAYHSHHMLALSELYNECLQPEFAARTSDHKQTYIPLFSSLKAKMVTNTSEFGPQYWIDNLTSPVLFNSAVAQILQNMRDPLFLEIGPHATLQGPIRDICGTNNSKFNYIPTMLRNKNCTESFLSAIGQLHQYDTKVDFSSLYPSGRTLTDLPTYPWSLKERYWYEARVSKEWRLRPYGHHELLGRKVAEGTTLAPSWRLILYQEHLPWIMDYKVRGDTLVPFMGFVAMAGEAIRQLSGIETGYKVKDVKFVKSLVLPESDQDTAEITTALRRLHDSDYYEFNISSYEEDDWVIHCEGLVKAIDHVGTASGEFAKFPRKVDEARWYDTFAKIGSSYGPAFQQLRQVSAATKTHACSANIEIEQDIMKGPFLFHPTAMDACIQLAIIAGAKGLPRDCKDLSMPSNIDVLEIYTAGSSMQAHAFSSSDNSTMNIECSANGRTSLLIKGLHFETVPKDQKLEASHTQGAYLEWKPDFDFLDQAASLIAPSTDDVATKLLEEFTCLCILDSAKRIAGKQPCNAHLDKYGKWLAREAKKIASGDAAFVVDASKFVYLSEEKRPQLIESHYSQLTKIPCRAPYAFGIHQIWSNIDQVYTGSADAAQLLTESNTLQEVYKVINFEYADFVSQMSNSRPNLRILEVGAGAGGTTNEILSKLVKQGQLPPYSTYTYTDVSPGYFPQARERFEGRPNLEYKVFDISRDPLEQGFVAGSYDLVLAPYVVHATPNIQTTLRNLHTVLRPDGCLLLSEPAAVGRSPGFIFGTFGSWWNGEADGREWEPFVTADRLHQDLRAAQFTGADSVIYDAPEPYRYWSTIVTRPEPIPKPPGSAKVVLISRDPGRQVARTVAEGLKKHGLDAFNGGLTENVASNHDIIFALDLERPFFENASSQDWSVFKTLMSKSSSTPSRKMLWLLPPTQRQGQNAKAGMSTGLLRTLRSELGISISTLEVDPNDKQLGDHIANIFQKIRSQAMDQQLLPDREFLIENGSISVGRYVPFNLSSELAKSHNSPGNGVVKFNLESSRKSTEWKRFAGTEDLPADSIELKAHYAKLSPQKGDLQGLGVSGEVTRVGSSVKNFTVGDKVVTIQLAQSLYSHLVMPADLVVPVPSSVDSRTAAAMALEYVIVAKAVLSVARVQCCQNVLVLPKNNPIADAAVQICKHIGAQVSVKEEDATNPRFDVVLNCGAGALSETVRNSMVEFGMIVNLDGQKESIVKGVYKNNLLHASVGLGQTKEQQCNQTQHLRQAISWLEKGSIKYTAPKMVVPAAELPSVVDTVTDAIVSFPKDIETVPATAVPTEMNFDPEASYIITGDLNGLGRAACTWMAERGARCISAISDSTGVYQEEHQFIEELGSTGCTFTRASGTTQDAESVQAALNTAPKPIKGVIHLATMADEASFCDTTHSDWTRALSSKAQGAWNLHEALENTPLDFFVVASSIAATIGLPGQASSNAADTVLEALCLYRRSRGLPASSIALGPVEGIWPAESDEKARRNLKSNGVDALTISESDFLQYLHLGMLPTAPNPIIAGLRTDKAPDDKALWRRDRRMGFYNNISNPTDNDASSSAEADSGLSDFIASANANPAVLDAQESAEFLAEEIGKRVWTFMLKPVEELDISLSPVEVGLDSLMAVEMRRVWAQMFGFGISVMEIMSLGALTNFGRFACKGLKAQIAAAA